MTVHVCPTGIHPPGVRSCYATHRCRCDDCRHAATVWARGYERRRLQEEWGARPPSLVDASLAAAELDRLTDAGLGLRAIADATGYGRTALWKVRSGKVARVRREMVDRLAAVIPDRHVLPGARVDGTRTRRLVEALIGGGWTKAAVGAWVTGNPDCAALQIGDGDVTAATADAVLQLHRSWRTGDIALNQRPDSQDIA